ncbi:beta-1,3-endoglucanase [Colletotrichum tofieldiae]|nr:beta-1,3-endoglucanase [Colletotrichum tofieldiae]
MAPSLLSTLSSALLLTSSVSAHKSYQVVDSYDSTNFLDKFGAFVSDHTTGNYNDVDPTGGYVSYKSAAEAQSMGLLKTVGEDLYLGVDSESVLDPNGIGRSSVRIESKSKYKQGLFVATFSHLPKPIDIVETWNEDNVNKVVLHTDGNAGECRIDGKNMTGTISKPNCANFAPGQSDNEGCAGLDPAAPFGSAEGGVSRDLGHPSFTTSTCAADKLFGEAKMVINIDLCGVAGDATQWSTAGGCEAKTGGATCKEWVAKNPAAFADVYFKLKSIKIYSLQEGETTTSAVSSQVASTAAPTSVVSSVVSSGIASEKPAETASGAETASVSASVPVSPPPVETPIEKPIETPAESLTTRLATSTVYETNIKTITSCAPEVTNCPAKDTPVIVTEVVPVTTTICPVFDVPTQLTVSKTEVVTITSCAPEVPNCPARTSTLTTQEVIPTTTAIPVESYIPPKPTGDKPVDTVSSQKPVGDITTALTTYKTNIVTITSCAPEVPDCPARTSTIITSEVIPTTIPAVPATSEAEKPVVTEKPPVQITTYKTNIVAITSCAPKTSTVITSEVIPAPTTEVEKPITTYKTNIVTITSCAPDVPNCPARTSTIVTSEIVPVPTTEGEKPVPVTTEIPTVLTTVKTNIVTITSCAPEVPDCPARTSTIITSELISTTVPVPGVPATPTEVSQNPPVPGSEKPITTPIPYNSCLRPAHDSRPEGPVPGKDQPSAPGSNKPSVPGGGVPTVGVPVPGETTSAQKPVPETPGAPATDVATATAPPAVPTTLVVAPSSLYNGTLTTARTPIGTGSVAPCIGAACPATTTGPVQAGAGKLVSGSFLLAAALAVFVM